MIENKAALFSLAEVGEILGSDSEGDPGFHRTSIYGVSTDSRTIEPGELFFALRGPRFDGHDFLKAAFERGAAAAMISRDKIIDLPLAKFIVVDDTLKALGNLAGNYRRKMNTKVVGVTGSNGKTTVKDLLFEIFSSYGPALRSEGNFNNLVGLPLSIFKLRNEHRAAVFELGMSAVGEIARLAEISKPDIGVITNVGPVHLEFLKSIEKVAEAKLEMVDHLNRLGVLILNGDDDMLNRKLKKAPVKILRFGLGTANDIRPAGLEFDSKQIPQFFIDDVSFTPTLPGIHNVYNILAAVAVTKALGMSTEKTAEAVNAFKSGGMRSEIFHKNGVTLLIDCYNANPASTRFALDTLSKMNSGGHRIAVLGDMLELGAAGRKYHEEIGDLARRLGINYLLALGPLSKYTVERFGDAALHFENMEALIERLLNTINTGDIILFKGSRGMVLEKVVDAVKSSL
jgi:UDP-N-acetylmuramoyl-tripeptide--D-alanyl-D-alanine ligase